MCVLVRPRDPNEKWPGSRGGHHRGRTITGTSVNLLPLAHVCFPAWEQLQLQKWKPFVPEVSTAEPTGQLRTEGKSLEPGELQLWAPNASLTVPSRHGRYPGEPGQQLEGCQSPTRLWVAGNLTSHGVQEANYWLEQETGTLRGAQYKRELPWHLICEVPLNKKTEDITWPKLKRILIN